MEEKLDASCVSDLFEERRILSEQRAHLVTAPCRARGSEPVFRVEVNRRRAMLQKIVRDGLVSRQHRFEVRGAAIANARRIDLDAILDEQLHPFEPIVPGGAPELLDQHLRLAQQPLAETRKPRPTFILAEAVRKEQLEVVVARI